MPSIPIDEYLRTQTTSLEVPCTEIYTDLTALFYSLDAPTR